MGPSFRLPFAYSLFFSSDIHPMIHFVKAHRPSRAGHPTFIFSKVLLFIYLFALLVFYSIRMVDLGGLKPNIIF